MTHIEKTVFISYRRTNFPWALNIYQYLTHHGYDVFFDYESINNGEFEKIILDNIKARAHFVVVLTPSALERCKEPNDWLRREIETAIDEKRNIVPLMIEGFDFSSPLIANSLTGKLAELSQRNGLPIFAAYFFEGMEKLCSRYLNVAVSGMSFSPLSLKAQVATKAQKSAASEAPPIEKDDLIAQEWFEKGYAFGERKNLDDAIHCYSEAIKLKPDFAEAYNNRGIARSQKNDYYNGFVDFTKAINLKPNLVEAYLNRGSTRKDIEGKIYDYNEVIRLDPDYADAYLMRAIVHLQEGNLSESFIDFKKAFVLGSNGK